MFSHKKGPMIMEKKLHLSYKYSDQPEDTSFVLTLN